ncbi:hypothetical protein EI94DRAFT_1803589 [Lactarius quietus]|nr:hypothetical protein EI94DRAFT_1803589 [Lactarius quietus]
MPPKPHLSISINCWQLGNPPPVEKGGWRETLLSPKSEDGFSVAAESSPGSQRSYGMNTEILPDVAQPHPPEDQTDSQMDTYPSSDEDDFDGDESSSPQSKCSYSMDSTLLLEGLDDFGMTAVPFHAAQGEGTDLALLLDVTLGIDALLLPGTFPQAAEPGEQIYNPLAAQEEDIGMGAPLCTNVDESAGSPSAAGKDARVDKLTGNPSAEVWKWGERPSHPSALEMQEHQAGTSLQLPQDALENDTELVQDNGFTPVFMTSLLLRDEMRRLHHIDNEIQQLYDDKLKLIAVVNRIVTSLECGVITTHFAVNKCLLQKFIIADVLTKSFGERSVALNSMV